MAKLFWLQPDNTIVEFPIKGEQTIIGRGGRSDVRIKHPGISSEHALIRTRDNIATLEDLKSTNGTRVNGRKVDKHTLRHGDQIEVGRERLMYFAELDNASRFAQPEPETPFSEPAALGEVVRTSNVPNVANVANASNAPHDVAPVAAWPTANMPDILAGPATPGQTAATKKMDRAQLADMINADTQAPSLAASSASSPKVIHSAGANAVPTNTPKFVASVVMLSGAATGKRFDLDKAVTTLGKEGKQVIEIQQIKPNAWQVSMREGARPPYVNGDAIAEPRVLVSGDIIEMTGVRLRFEMSMAATKG
jgi:pSer/pThr/pTyr-binding forkhead associated (FHA) protein